MSIIELRVYAQTKSMVDNAQKQSDVPPGPMVDLVRENIAEDMKDRARSRKRKDRR